ncbi:MAG: peptidase [Sulfurimonas sp.]|nr:peptidase [Sulfurimonas sp.]
MPPIKRTKEQIIARMNEVGKMNRFCGRGLCSRSGSTSEDVTVIDVQNRTIPFILVSEDNAGERYDWWNDEVYIEELDPDGARLDELQTFFKDHNQTVDTAIGRIENCRVDGDQIKADVIFGTDEDASKVFTKYQDRILTDVSVGYYVNDIIITSKKDEPDHILVTDYIIVELSAVWKGFDKGATMGRAIAKPAGEIKKLRNTDILRRKFNLKTKENR